MYNYSFISINHIAIPSFTPTMDPFVIYFLHTYLVWLIHLCKPFSCLQISEYFDYRIKEFADSQLAIVK